MKGSHAALAALAAALALMPAAGQDAGLSLSGSTQASIAAWEDRGSPLVPAGAAAAHAGGARIDFRAEAGETARCAFEGSVAIDAFASATSFEARELWAEWRPGPLLALRAGRQRLGFGSGYGWNPSNDLDVPRTSTDPSLPRVGADAFGASFDAGSLTGFPLSFAAVAVAPPPGVGLSGGRLGAEAYAYAGEVEVMVVASISGGDGGDWLAGGWATFPLGSLVIGLEAAARRGPDLFRPGPGGLPSQDLGVRASATATATLKAGDFVLIAEAYWNGAAYTRQELAAILAAPAYLPYYAGSLGLPGSVGAFHGLLRLAWTSGDWSAAAGAVIDLGTGAFVCTAKVEASVQGKAGLGLELSLPAPAALLDDDELGLGGKGPAAKVSITAYF